MEKAIKQRLLGGLVLVAGAALFLPMLLDGAGAPLTVPPMPAPPKLPALEAVAPKLDQQVQTADQSVTAAHEGQTFAPAEAGEPAAEEEVSADAAAVLASPATAASAAVPSPEDSKRLAAAKATSDKAAKDKLAQEKLAREKAEKAKAEQQAALQKSVQKPVQKTPTPAAAPVAAVTPKPAALPEAWVVQVASLASREKADALVQSLRKKSYRAVVHQQGNAWKVVIGPELRREVAESIKSRLATDPELKLNGWVQAYKP